MPKLFGVLGADQVEAHVRLQVHRNVAQLAVFAKIASRHLERLQQGHFVGRSGRRLLRC